MFVLIQPCTTWDTRFATISSHKGQIGPTADELGFVYHFGAGAFLWSAYGGKPSCTDTAIVANYGVSPYAVVYTLYTTNATGDGWVKAYGDGDPDSSSATISLYYTVGPTRSTTVVALVGRGAAQNYDICVASQYSSVDVAASVIGYFIKSAATALQCTEVYESTALTIVAGSAACRVTTTCPAGYTAVAGAAKWNAGGSAGGIGLIKPQASTVDSVNLACWGNPSGSSASVTPGTRCCRFTGR